MRHRVNHISHQHGGQRFGLHVTNYDSNVFIQSHTRWFVTEPSEKPSLEIFGKKGQAFLESMEGQTIG